ncbi:MAG TPA: VOC family protein [Steroidobacteraceae bacterium]|nr:VOC family protein [Steroidobacteraceae bacterium]
MKLIPYLMFPHGRCREAFNFYAKALNGTVISVSTYGQMPGADQHLPPAAMDKIANIHLVAGGASIMGSDNVMGPETSEARNDTTVNIDVDSIEEAERVYAAMSAGGKVEMPLGESPWALRFAMFTDRYGKPWMVNLMRSPA